MALGISDCTREILGIGFKFLLADNEIALELDEFSASRAFCCSHSSTSFHEGDLCADRPMCRR